jgi:hypothetical protein
LDHKLQGLENGTFPFGGFLEAFQKPPKSLQKAGAAFQKPARFIIEKHFGDRLGVSGLSGAGETALSAASWGQLGVKIVVLAT